MNPRSLASLFPLLCLTAPVFAQGGEVDLRLVPKKDASVWLLREMKQSQTMEMMGQQMESENNVTHTLHVTVKEIDDKGVATVETKIVRIVGNMSLPQLGDVEFDSLEPQEEPEEGDIPSMIAKSVMAGAGKTFGTKVDQNGRVVELMADAKELIDSAKGGGAMRMPTLDESTLKQMVESAFGNRPEKPTAIGGKWPHSKKEGSGAESKLELTLAKVDADAFEITGAGTVEKAATSPDDKGGNPMMKNAKIKNGKVAGTVRVSRQDGFVVDAKHDVSMDMETSIPQMGEMTMEMKSSVTMKRTTAEAATAKKAAAKPADAPKDDKKAEPKEEKKEEKKEPPK